MRQIFYELLRQRLDKLADSIDGTADSIGNMENDKAIRQCGELRAQVEQLRIIVEHEKLI